MYNDGKMRSAHCLTVILLWVVPCLLPMVSGTQDVTRKFLIPQDNENDTVLFRNPKDFPLTILVKDLQKNETSFLNLTFNLDTIASFNLTVDEVLNSHIEISETGEQDFVSNGKRFLLGISTSTVLTFKDDGGKRLSLDMENFKNMKLKDIEGDPYLLAEPSIHLTWEFAARCNLYDISVSVTAISVIVTLNDIQISNLSLPQNVSRANFIHIKEEGLLLLVLNSHTCRKTYENVMLTADYGGYRDLVWILDNIQPGRIVILASLRDGAAFLPLEVKYKLKELGSSWPLYYMHRDSWLNIFVKGGKTFQEVLITNLASFNSSGSPIRGSLSFGFDGSTFHQDSECDLWPATPRWRARRIFCDDSDGFLSLCSCRNPFDIPNREELLQKMEEPGKIPMIVVAGKRTRHLFHLFETLGHQKSVVRENILIVTDGFHEEVARLAHILDISVLVHKPEGINAMRISRTFRFALYNALKSFKEADAFIILEEDLQVSPDFYSYMQQLFPIFNLDPTIFCVNAYNHLSYPHTSKDPSQLYRVRTLPAYGWMISRRTVTEIVPRWLPANVDHDWDYLVGSDLVREDRECVIPDVNRSYHWATMGFHLKASYFAEKLYLSRNMNLNPDVQLQPLERLIKSNYERDYLEILKQAKVLPIDDETTYDIDKKISPGEIYVLFAQMKTEIDSLSIRLAGEILGVWSRDVRDMHNSSWKINFRNSTIFVVGVPASPYKFLMPKGGSVITGNNDTTLENDFAEYFDRSLLVIKHHENSFNIPLSELFRNDTLRT